MKVEKSEFGKTTGGERVYRFVCTNENGLSMSLITYGAIMQSMVTPDASGRLANINLGAETLQGYENCAAYLGATVGRFCNRIGGAAFTLDGKEYQLAATHPPNCLHGGVKGFSHVVWHAEEIHEYDLAGIRFTHVSPDGDEGFPGELKVTADYLLNNSNELLIEFKATTDTKTVLNLTNHNYWNLGGDQSGSIEDHVLQVESDKILSVDPMLIPTGEFTNVEGTELDFRTPWAIGARIDTLRKTPAKGYDHCYALRSQSGELALAATVCDPKSGRVMKVSTSQPGIQLYTGNWLLGDTESCGFQENEAFCLETQHYPDAPNIPSFPTTELNPGQEFNQKTVHWFGVNR
ncbi:MAG: aldose epimerase family protein [Planctomycetota bacterium]|nr:aldose epimerase family protein [Planctomycetota bacterium]